MLPIILITDNESGASSFIEGLKKTLGIKDHNVFSYRPETKEFSIAQMRELIKTLKFAAAQPQLYILYEFDTASQEAQNAFLKTLEEHQSLIQFLMIVKNAETLLPTIQSRSKKINLLNRTPEKFQDPHIFSELEQLVNGEEKSIAKLSQHQSFKKEPVFIFSQLLEFFRTRLSYDLRAPEILKELISQHSLIQHNHLDPQTSLDYILLTISKRYKT